MKKLIFLLVILLGCFNMSQAQNQKKNSEPLKQITITRDCGSLKYLNAINSAYDMIKNLPKGKCIVVDTVTLSTKGTIIDGQVIRVFARKMVVENKHTVTSYLTFHMFDNKEEVPEPVWTGIIILSFNHNCGEASINYFVTGDNGETFHPEMYSESQMGDLLVKSPRIINK